MHYLIFSFRLMHMADEITEGSAMTSHRASFYSRDPDRLIRDKKDPSKKKFIGMERRRANRRRAQDRRVDVRFDLTKTERRQLVGRREDDATPKFW